MKGRMKERANRLKTDIPAVFLAMKHPDTPKFVKILAAVAVIYALSPIDLIPDFIPVIGYLDDLLILPGLIALILKKIPAEVMTDCRRQAENLWQDGTPKKWRYAIPILAVWAFIITLIILRLT